mmetsp:Transcript_50709/g.127336  ORF Transcript_50709/g.127336 Transcript_50709/m.127336 type:complete len:467 (-) Transcript_50709:28-1428(-)|eukprot:CAMPEP_0177651462 /NCGR_PEP_ID=MMETSP0447-20121125/12562_1 /TAXON_ID=0 /ORGANISM="Stygamoeba regulata, Strain BSH-02190019" /LENGTH=466 /DNA_ID=CAMNT_0019154547 /DNA_START=157 /DNA_END=1557 /DNA_ORIENTATION=+
MSHLSHSPASVAAAGSSPAPADGSTPVDVQQLHTGTEVLRALYKELPQIGLSSGKALLLFVVPLTALRRRLRPSNDTLQRGVAFATFAAIFRSVRTALRVCSAVHSRNALSGSRSSAISSSSSSSSYAADEGLPAAASSCSSCATCTGSRSASTLSAVLMLVTRALDTLSTRLRCVALLRSLLTSLLRSAWRYSVHHPESAAAAIAALGAIQVDSTIPSSIVVSWLSIRSIRPYLPDVPYGPTIMMCLTGAHILSTWISKPDELHLSYKFFLDVHGGKSRAAYRRLSQAPTFLQMVVHPKTRNNYADLPKFWIAAFRRALKVYAPLYTAFFIFSKYRSVPNFAKNIVRSSCFLATYCSLAWFAGCWILDQRIYNVGDRTTLAKLVWISGLATLIERASRRAELAAYCTTYSVDCIYRYLLKTGHVRPIHSIGTMLAAVALGLMFKNHKDQPVLLTRWILGIGTEEN